MRDWEWSLSGSARWFASYLLLAALLRQLLKRQRFWSACCIVVASSLAAQVLFVLHRLEPDECLGALVAALVIGLACRNAEKVPARLIWWLVLAGNVVYALAPFNFSSNAQAFNWLPFAGVLEANVPAGFFRLTAKLYLYTGLLWLAERAGAPLFRATFTLFAVALLELLQQLLPGRVAELNDPLLVLLSAALLARSREYSTRLL
jgi:pimeloyl-ACP methyl ester carboxylesterase